MSPATAVLLLTLLLGIQPINTDLYLPALPTLQRELSASTSATQLTLSALIICFGLAQLVGGPLSDRFGRRPVLLTGMVFYTLASVASARSPTIEWRVFWRALQGAGLCAAVSYARSIGRDLYAPQDGARIMRKALGGLGPIAMASPLVGGIVVQGLDWHAALPVVAAFGAVTLAIVMWKYDETVPARNPRATRAAALPRNWAAVLGPPTFRAWTLLSGFGYGGLFFLLAGSSLVYIGLLGTVSYGFLMRSQSFACMVGTSWCRRLLARHGLREAPRRGAGFTLAGGLGIAGLALAGVRSVWAVMLSSWLFCIGHGVRQPCGQAGAVGPLPEKAGTAASLSGFHMMSVAFFVGLLKMSLLLCATAWTLVQRHGDPVAEHLAAQAKPA